MSTRDSYYGAKGIIGLVREHLATKLAAERPQDTNLAGQITAQLDVLEQQLLADGETPVPADGGLSALLGLGSETKAFGAVPVPTGVPSYDQAFTLERLYAVADLYYCYQMERLGLFRAIQKLEELFRAGTLHLSTGPGAISIYRFDRREVLRYTMRERMQAYRRVFGYTSSAPPRGSSGNDAFHALLTQFALSVAQLFRDKRISETIAAGPAAAGHGFGSVAISRRAGLDLRNNLKRASYGDVNVLTAELMQLIGDAFGILSSPDVRHQFGAADGWDALEEVLERYLGERPVVSQRSRMAETGRDIINWLAHSHVLASGRTTFETLAQAIAEPCEEWITSVQALGDEKQSRSMSSGNVVQFASRRRASH